MQYTRIRIDSALLVVVPGVAYFGSGLVLLAVLLVYLPKTMPMLFVTSLVVYVIALIVSMMWFVTKLTDRVLAIEHN